MFKVARIICIYWSIECSSQVWFVEVFRVARITYIYRPIECTPKVSFVHVFKLICINSPIECTQKLDLLRCSKLQRCKITPWTKWMYYVCNSQICVSSSYIHLGRKVPWLLFFQRIKVEASHHVCLRVSFLILDLLFVYNLHLSTKSCAIVYGHDLWTTTHTWSMVKIYKKSDRIRSQVEYSTLWKNSPLDHILWHLGTIAVLIFARGELQHLSASMAIKKSYRIQSQRSLMCMWSQSGTCDDNRCWFEQSGSIDWNALESCSSKGLAGFCFSTRQWHGLCIMIYVPRNKWQLEIS